MQSGNIAQQDNYVPCHSNGRSDRRWFGYETGYSVFYACGIPFVTPSSGKTTSLSITFDAYDKYSGSATPQKTYNVLITSTKITSFNTLKNQTRTTTVTVPRTVYQATSTVTFNIQNLSLSPNTTYYFYIWHTQAAWSCYLMTSCSIYATYDGNTVWINTGGNNWQRAIPWVCTGGTNWQQAIPWICTGGTNWQQCGG